MKLRNGMVVVAAVLAVTGATALAGTIHPDLRTELSLRSADETVSVLVYLADRVDLASLSARHEAAVATNAERHGEVVLTLREKAQQTQGSLRDLLKDMQAAGQVEAFKTFWVANVVRVDVRAGSVAAIAAHRDVDTVYLNYEIEGITPVEIGPASAAPEGPRLPEPGIVAVRAPEVWTMGYTGAGVLVANIDTGVAGGHEALASRWAGTLPQYAGHPEWAWLDPVNYNNDFPFDSNGHGTHTMGTICGGAPGDQVGVAPGANWIASGAIDRVDIPTTVADAIESFQWILDPDGNPNTYWDVPAVCSNSWGVTTGHGYPPCDETFWTYLDACQAGGIVILFSAGNEGTSGLRRPSDRATDDYRTVAVAAVDPHTAGYPVANFSSRGPTYCTPTGVVAIKPDVAAPGVDTRSASPSGGYAVYSGTSMASPHVNGVVALMREACPDLTVEEVIDILYATCTDLGTPGKDNSYGYGIVDAVEAVNMALDFCGDSPPRVRDGYFETAVETPVVIALFAADHDGGPDPIAWKVDSLPAAGNTLEDAGNGHVITAGELPYTLVGNGNEVIYTPGAGFYGNDSFTYLATDGGVPPDGGDSDIATVSGLVSYGPPTIATTELPQGCLDHAYGPVALQADQGQPELTWTTISDEYFEFDLGSSAWSAVGVGQDWHQDDGSWVYNLPFPFPYFDEVYTSCHVCSNGFIDFESSSTDYSNSTSELLENVRIAPLWDDIRTDFGGDIYIDESVAGQVTIRWNGERYSSGEAIDMSCTLDTGGTIVFHYGPGNTGLSPTIGISAGDGIRYLLSTYDGAGSLTYANSHEFVLPVPLPLGIELSADGVLSGTAAAMGTFQPRFRVTDSLNRTDVKQLTLVITESARTCWAT
jgi:subtilisin family serine protease